MTEREQIRAGDTALGIEFGSTRIKACLVDAQNPEKVLAVGSHSWENAFVDRLWTYALEDVWAGLRSAYADLVADVKQRYGVALEKVGCIGISAMMHGYLAFDDAGELLVPFRTWRNTNTGPAAAELSALFELNIPLRWSIAHYRQAMLDDERHVAHIARLTTLAGCVHEALTGRHVLGAGDASGMFPLNSSGLAYDEELMRRFDDLAPGAAPIARLLPEVLVAGQDAGELTPAGAALLDPTGTLPPGIPFCPPEGDAGTGMVATDAVAPRTGNVSVGTSVFAMVVLERPLTRSHPELDLVATPAGDPVAMVHCNNGANELAAWVGMFVRFAEAAGMRLDPDVVFDVVLREALSGDADAGGLLSYNHLAGEPIAGLPEGRPLFVRAPDSSFTLANAMRSQVYGVFGTLALGMRVLDEEGVRLERMMAHGGMFRTAGVAQRFLAAALDAPVAVADTAAEGGAWGMAVLAAYRATQPAETSLPDYLSSRVFAATTLHVADPSPDDVAGFSAYLERYRAGLAVEEAAVALL